VRFPCLHCRVKVKVSAAFAGRTVDCPECGKRTLVPELDEVGTFGLAGGSRPAADDEEPADERPLAEWWPDGTKLNLPVSWRAPLATAREHAESERWTKAVGLLNGVYQKSLDATDGGSPVVRKSLAFCLGRWAARGLDRLEEDGEKPSKPIRRVLKLASEKLRFGGSFSTTACPLCDRRLDHLVGTTQIRTKAGSAYVCCAAPTRGDLGLVAEVANINRKLLVGMSLDSENAQIPAALARLPEWFRVVDMGPAGWTKRIVDTSGGIGGDVGGGEVAGEIAGHLAVRMIAGMLSA
jgi:DNA-directed RNA polymerase subunit RPC12/RpoP